MKWEIHKNFHITRITHRYLSPNLVPVETQIQTPPQPLTNQVAHKHTGNTHHVNELGEFQLDLHLQRVGHVDDRPHQLVVVGKQVIVQPLGVRVPARPWG